jgi:nucleotide-binding universal stress UspA family protein
VLHAFHDVVARIEDAHLVDGLGGAYEEHRLAVAESIAGMSSKYPDVLVQTRLARGYAGDSLVTMSGRMSLVVVGAHHGGAASAIMFGSAAATVVEHANCPVAVIPTAESR